MKTMLMGSIGGKIVYCLFTNLLLSCDTSIPFTIGNGKNMVVDTDCGKLTLAGSVFASSVFFTQKSEGSFWVHPDSLKIEFIPNYVGTKKIAFSKSGEQRKNNDSFQVNNSYVSVNLSLFSPTPVNLDTVTMLVLPGSYLMCNNKSLLTDTIRIRLKSQR